MLAGALAPQAGAVSLQSVGAYSEPVYVTSDPGDPDRLFVVERAGRIRLTTPGRHLDLRRLSALVDSGFQERGLLSMAFAPDFATSGLLYVDYTGKDAGSIHVAELRASGDTADPATLRNVLTIPHPTYPNHNGGQLQFGPDGYLYVSTGDGGGGGDPFENAQDTGSLLGKILRIDPRRSGTQPYTVPAGNPFVGTTGRPEIWSLGFRNPYRFSFDRADRRADRRRRRPGPLGGARLRPAARRRARRQLRLGLPRGPAPLRIDGLPGVRLTEPVLEYSHSTGGCAVTGGYVVRDPGLEELAGRYVYADYCKGEIRSTVLGLPERDRRPLRGPRRRQSEQLRRGFLRAGLRRLAHRRGLAPRRLDADRLRGSAPGPVEPCSQSVEGTPAGTRSAAAPAPSRSAAAAATTACGAAPATTA